MTRNSYQVNVNNMPWSTVCIVPVIVRVLELRVTCDITIRWGQTFMKAYGIATFQYYGTFIANCSESE
jgi:hypothetical protein